MISGTWASTYATPWEGQSWGGPDVVPAEQWGQPVSPVLGMPGGDTRPGWDPASNPVMPVQAALEDTGADWAPCPEDDWGAGQTWEWMSDRPAWGHGSTSQDPVLPAPSGGAWRGTAGELDGFAALSRDEGMAAYRRQAPVASTDATTAYAANGIEGEVLEPGIPGDLTWKLRGAYAESNPPYQPAIPGQQPERAPIPVRKAGMWAPLWVRRDEAMRPRFVTPGTIGSRQTQDGYYTAATTWTGGGGRARWGQFWGMPAPSGQFITPAEPDMGPVYDGSQQPAQDWAPPPQEGW